MQGNVKDRRCADKAALNWVPERYSACADGVIRNRFIPGKDRRNGEVQ